MKTVEQAIQQDVLGYVAENEPVDQEDVVEEFGNRGLVALRTLMRYNKVSYSVDWKLISGRGYGG